MNEVRDTSGKFAPKSEVPRKVRSVNLTDDAWQWLAAVAEKAAMSRNDYLEALAFGNIPLMETVSSDKIEMTEQPESDVLPFMETVTHFLTTKEEALAHAAIFGFTREEALADAHFQISMLQANYDELEDKYEAAKRDKEKLENRPAVTTGHLYQEIENLKERNRLLIIKSREERQKLEEELKALKYRDESQSRRLQEKQARMDEFEIQLETERADREEIEAELSELKQNSAPAATLSEKLTPDA
ncbi:hypothetical protein, partial [Microcoleus sp. OTE_8_concoct_300]|uniref:hypothetical protein n=1 Tax=Microcoleus sp. OTE_8_concoct_300 TaxID=2964710 RepID=UPI00403F575B